MVNTAPKILAIIPARGGSKRIPRKNIRDFKGKPMIAWTIEAARDANIFEEIIVSTDCPDTAAIAIEHGAQCPFMRTEHADDFSPVSEATLAALHQAEEHYEKQFDITVQLMANCPLRSSETIQKMLDAFSETDADALLSHTKFGWLNPWWACTMDTEHKPNTLFEEELKKRSQDLPELYCPTGAIWAAKSNILKQHKTFHIPQKRAYVISWQEALDIDNEEDWDMAEIAFEWMQQHKTP